MARYLLALSVVFYAACLPLDAFCVQGSCSNWPGWSILVFGFIPFAASPANLTWLANPALFATWISIYLHHEKSAKLFSFTAILLAGSFLLMHDVVIDEGGGRSHISGYATGYWLWLASVSAAVASAFAMKGRMTAPAA